MITLSHANTNSDTFSKIVNSKVVPDGAEIDWTEVRPGEIEVHYTVNPMSNRPYPNNHREYIAVIREEKWQGWN